MINGIFFEAPAESDFLGHQMAEIYRDGIYKKHLQGKKDLTIIDVGGNVGTTSYYFSQFAKMVHVLEPAAEHFNVLNFMIDFNKLTNVTPHKLALSNIDGESTFWHNPNKTMDSLIQTAPDDKPEVVKTIRLDTFFKENNIDHVDFMKLDTEGEEPNILCGDAFQLVGNKIDKMIIEIHHWNGRNPNQLKDALKNVGFTISTIPHDTQLWLAERL